MRRVVLLCVLLAAACGPTDDTATAMNTSAGSTGDPSEPCGCFEPGPSAPEATLLCAEGQECPSLGTRFDVGNFEETNCVLESLRDRVHGVYHFYYDEIPGSQCTRGDIYVLEDGSVAVQSTTIYDGLQVIVSELRQGDPKPASFFQDCLDSDTVAERLPCFYEPIVADSRVCLPGGEVHE